MTDAQGRDVVDVRELDLRVVLGEGAIKYRPAIFRRYSAHIERMKIYNVVKQFSKQEPSHAKQTTLVR